MEWLCDGVTADWQAWSVFVAAAVFTVEQLSRRADRRAAGRLIARLVTVEVRRIDEVLGSIKEKLESEWAPDSAAPTARVREELIKLAAGLSTNMMDRSIPELTVMPRRVTDKVSSLLGWTAQIQRHPFFDAAEPYSGSVKWLGKREHIAGLVGIAKSTAEQAVEIARRTGAPATLVDKYWRWPRLERAERRAIEQAQSRVT